MITSKFSSSNLEKNKYKILLIIFLFMLSIVSFFLYIKTYFVLFPIINAVILLSYLFIYRGKYRIYALYLYLPFITFFNYKPLKIGSFFSYIIIIYCLVIIIETLFSREKIENLDKKRILTGLTLAFISLFLSLIFSGINGFVKSISIFAYIMSISFLAIDKKASKNLSILILISAISLLAANILACFVIYVLKGEMASSFIKNFLADTYYRQYLANNGSFRYPGLSSDPNYLGMYVLVLSAVFLINYKKINYRGYIAAIIAILQIFPIIGASRNYLICLLGLISFLCLYYMKTNNFGWAISIVIMTTILLLFLVFSNTSLSSVLLRIVNIDQRNGILNSLSSGRTDLQSFYLSDYISHPFSFIIGKGFGKSLLNGDSAHSIYVMSFRYFGIFGTILYYSYILSFVDFEISKKNKVLFVPLIIIAVYGLTLDYISYSEMLLFIIFIYSLSFTKKLDNLPTEENLYYEISI